MSGIEVVGLLLGAFPLLISAAEHYKEGFEPLLRWKRFRKDFIAFIDAVDIEKQLFSNMLQRFLISADVPGEELRLFMTDAEYQGWQNKQLVEIWKGRLGSSYDAYMSTLRTMAQLVADLQELLCLKNGKVDWAADGANKWDYQLKRIRLSFSKRGVRTLEALENHNRKLRELLDSSDKLESLKITRKDTSWGGIFESIRKHASSLHTAIKKNWNCDCITSHHGDLQLQCRSSGDSSSTFHMAFDIPSVTDPTSMYRKEVQINVKQVSKRVAPVAKSPLGLSMESSMESSICQLRQDFNSKSSSQLSIASRPILVPSVSDSSVTTSRSSITDVYSKNSSSQSTAASTLSMSGTEVVLMNSASRNWLTKSRKPQKSVRMQTPSDPPQLVSPIISPILPTKSHNVPPEQADLELLTAAMDDLCCKIRNAVRAKDLGYLVEENSCYELQCLQEEQMGNPGNSLINLDTILRSTTLNRRQRYRIAHILASSVLQLQSTPWLLENLDKRNILFSKRGADIALEKPYIRHTFKSTKLIQDSSLSIPTPEAARFATRNNLNSLGILLLELCFGQVIENQEFRKEYLGADGKPHDSTDYMTARDWAEMVCEEDPALEHVIKCCVLCIFEAKADWESKKFTQAVYCSVVEPLEKINNMWARVS